MRRQVPGLHCRSEVSSCNLDGMFLVQIDSAFYRWHQQKPFLLLQFLILEPVGFNGQTFTGRIYCTERALWKLNWFLRDFGYDPDLLSRDQVDEKALRKLQGVVRTSCTSSNGHFYQDLQGFAPAAEWVVSSAVESASRIDRGSDGL
jgi:hypothetical protein